MMIDDFWIIEVFYNQSGQLYDETSPVHKTNVYHSLFKPVIGKTKEEVESKIRTWFALEKHEYKIIKMEVQKTLV